MASTSHHVTSHYTTPEQEGDDIPEQELEALWNAESAKIKFARRPYKIPTFVRGSLDTEEGRTASSNLDGNVKADTSVSDWYQELSASRATAMSSQDLSQIPSTSAAVPSPAPRSSSLPPPPRPRPRGKARRAQPDWFIHRALSTQAQTQVEPPSRSLSLSTPGLAALLAQQPPPKPSEPAFKPSVWYALDPSNKGFAMLRRSGWEEGYGLGAAHPPAKVRSEPATRGTSPSVRGSERAAEDEETMPEIVDLTGSRSPTPEEDSIFSTAPASPATPTLQQPPSSDTSHSTALLTPLRPVLKADRLGIGLKAKKKSSFSSKEIREHIRAGQEAHRKAEMERRGKGWKAWARQAKKDSEERRAMMSYLNS